MQQNFIELVSVPFQAGESKLFHVSGRYFELIDAPNPVDVLLSDRNGAQRGIMRAAEASFYLKDTDFATVQLTSATAQTIRFGYGTGEAGTRRAAGAVSIANQPTVNLDAAQLAQLLLLNRPLQPTGNWNSTATLVANTPLTVFAPGANVNGAIIHRLQAFEFYASQQNLVFIAKASAPASVTDGDVIAQSELVGVYTNDLHTLKLEVPTRIAAGLGLYLISSFAGTTNRLKSARYTLL